LPKRFNILVKIFAEKAISLHKSRWRHKTHWTQPVPKQI